MLFSFKNKAQRPWRGTLERDAMILWDVDALIESYHVETIKIPYTMPSGRPSYYTPDRLVHFRGGKVSLLVEIKPAKKLRKKRSLWKARFDAARAEAQNRGWIFEVWTEKQIRGTKLQNAVFLREFLAHPTDSVFEKRILDMLGQLKQTTGEKLLQALTSDMDERNRLLPQFWKLIVVGKIEADWATLITIHSPIRIKSDAREK